MTDLTQPAQYANQLEQMAHTTADFAVTVTFGTVVVLYLLFLLWVMLKLRFTMQ